MAYKTVLLDEARVEVLDAAFYYKQFGTELSNDILAKFFETLALIEGEPFIYQANSRGYRKANLKRLPYKIIFKLTGDSITVVAFTHHKRKPGYWKNR